MLKRLKKKAKKPGLAPGVIVHIGEKKVETAQLSLISYNEGNYTRNQIDSVGDLADLDPNSIHWINLYGLHDTKKLTDLGDMFNLHPLVLEDICNTDHQPKHETFDDYLFVIMKMISYDKRAGAINVEQMSFILKNNYIISFQERVGDVFEPVRDRIKAGKGRLRKRNADYLLYALIDILVDHYFVVLEKAGDQLEMLEDKVIDSPEQSIISEIHRLKNELLFMRKSVWPVRELVSALTREENPLIEEKTIPFLRDIYDHVIQVIDTIETYRDMVAGLLDVYLSSISNKMNEVMKVLTIIATIFIPLTFIAGVYGMNFENMPELKWPWGYPVVWIIMLVLGIIMVIYFKRKKWL